MGIVRIFGWEVVTYAVLALVAHKPILVKKTKQTDSEGESYEHKETIGHEGT
jgi:hypothetical protein